MVSSGRSTIRIFISSPADVRPERSLAERIIGRLDREFAYHFHVEAVLWEREPLVANLHFQDPANIPAPHGSDIVVVILWSRLGLPLPQDQFRGAVSGRPVTGTEWEFEDALAAAQKNNVPALMLYRKLRPVTATLDDDAELEQRRAQKRLVDDFMARWFGVASSGQVTAASQTFNTTEEFEEKLYLHLRELLERRVQREDDSTSAAIRWYDPPFRGLLSFDVRHSPMFFGRTRARNEVREMLAAQAARDHAFVLVLGASGSGKSSLVKAGVLPDLMLPGMIGHVALCRYAVMRPSDVPAEPLASVATAMLGDTALPELAGLRYTPERLVALLRDAPAQAGLFVEQALAEAAKTAHLTELGEARLLLVVDQLEEMFAPDRVNDAQRERFVGALAALAQTGLVWVIATMRSDFFNRIESFPALARLANPEGRYLLLAPTEGELGQIVREPPREAGLRFEVDAEGVRLDDVIREAAARDPNSLPLLSFVLDELWRGRTDRGVLTFAAYERLGGLEGALARRAEERFLALGADERDALPRVLRALVGIDSDGRIAARRATLVRFPPGSAGRNLVDVFSAADTRLFITTAEPGEPEPSVRVAHEALFTHWSRAKACIDDDRSDMQLRDRLAEQAARRQATDVERRDSLLLGSGLPLDEASDLVARRGDELDVELRAYVAASRESVAVALAREDARRREEAGRRAELQRLESERLRQDVLFERTRANDARRLGRRTQVFAFAMLTVALACAYWSTLSHGLVHRSTVFVVSDSTDVLADGVPGALLDDDTYVDCSGFVQHLPRRFDFTLVRRFDPCNGTLDALASGDVLVTLRPRGLPLAPGAVAIDDPKWLKWYQDFAVFQPIVRANGYVLQAFDLRAHRSMNRDDLGRIERHRILTDVDIRNAMNPTYSNRPFEALAHSALLFALVLFVVVLAVALAARDATMGLLAAGLLIYAGTAVLPIDDGRWWDDGLAWALEFEIVLVIFGFVGGRALGFRRVRGAWPAYAALLVFDALLLAARYVRTDLGRRILYPHAEADAAAVAALAVIAFLAIPTVWCLTNRDALRGASFWRNTAAFAGPVTLLFCLIFWRYDAYRATLALPLLPAIVAAAFGGMRGSRPATLLGIGLAGWLFAFDKEVDLRSVFSSHVEWMPLAFAWLVLFAIASIGGRLTTPDERRDGEAATTDPAEMQRRATIGRPPALEGGPA